jgi:hypothetical protein
MGGQRRGVSECQGSFGAPKADPGNERRKNHAHASQFADGEALRLGANHTNHRRAEPQSAGVRLTFASRAVDEGQQLARLAPGSLLERPRLIELVKPLGGLLDEVDGLGRVDAPHAAVVAFGQEARR